MPASISIRTGIRWMEINDDEGNNGDEARWGEWSEPTDTVVLTASNGWFLDVRFLSHGGDLDWAFAGKRRVEGKITKFEHMIDSRTADAATVVDEGENVEMEDGSIVERGKMINPATGTLMLYEEKWREEEGSEGLVIRRKGKEETWQAIVGDYQLALGRYQDGAFWAWQARKKDGVWERVHATKNAMPEDSHWVILANE
ncbi:Protein Hri1 [Pleurotus pulmonarius]